MGIAHYFVPEAIVTRLLQDSPKVERTPLPIVSLVFSHNDVYIDLQLELGLILRAYCQYPRKQLKVVPCS